MGFDRRYHGGCVVGRGARCRIVELRADPDWRWPRADRARRTRGAGPGNNNFVARHAHQATLQARLAQSASASAFLVELEDILSNVLRALAFTPVCAPADAVRFAHNVETLAVCEFEIDDQSGEDLAVGLQHLRAMDAIIDVIQAPVFGKKGRMAVHVRILTRPATVDAVIAACLDQTSTLGVRHYAVQRTSLARDEGVASVLTTLESNQVEQAIRVKRVERPAGSVTRKAEMDDLAQAASTRAAREQLRRQVETPHASDDDDDDDNNGVDQR